MTNTNNDNGGKRWLEISVDAMWERVMWLKSVCHGVWSGGRAHAEA